MTVLMTLASPSSPNRANGWQASTPLLRTAFLTQKYTAMVPRPNPSQRISTLQTLEKRMIGGTKESVLGVLGGYLAPNVQYRLQRRDTPKTPRPVGQEVYIQGPPPLPAAQHHLGIFRFRLSPRRSIRARPIFRITKLAQRRHHTPILPLDMTRPLVMASRARRAESMTHEISTHRPPWHLKTRIRRRR